MDARCAAAEVVRAVRDVVVAGGIAQFVHGFWYRVHTLHSASHCGTNVKVVKSYSQLLSKCNELYRSQCTYPSEQQAQGSYQW